MRTDLFDFELPEDRIALHPVSPRDAARLLVVWPDSPSPRLRGEGRGEGQTPISTEASAPHSNPLPPPEESGGERVIEDRIVRELPELLRPGDALVFNDTRVIPAALSGERIRGNARAHVSVNLIRRIDESRWRAFARPAKRLVPGDLIRFGNEARVCLLGSLEATVAAKGEAGEIELSFNLHSTFLDEAIGILGDMPLPPYIALRRPADEQDRADYQTVYARHEGAVAAPTAGLHFTSELFGRLDARGVERHFVTLHVGAGTFLPVKADDTAEHRMHAEWGEVGAEAAAALNHVRNRGGRIVAVGTTSLRLLESAADEDGTIRPFCGETEIFITPGYRFRAVDMLMTNFHLPRSTLFMLVAAFSGLETMKAVYAHAVRSGYRFYSYGDACLLFPAR